MKQPRQSFGTQEEMFFCKLTFSEFRNQNQTQRLLRADAFIRQTITVPIQKGEAMKTLKVMLLMMVIALGLAGAATAAQAGCCASDDCCASCTGSC
jgi:hypothetical protein